LASAEVGGTVARAAVGDSLQLRPLLVVGRVGWESKFLVRALEERGWRVDMQLAVTPQARVTQGSTTSLDTGRTAAVLVVGEATGISPTALQRYVRDGGGVILLDGAELTLPTLAVGDTSVVGSAPPTSTHERGAAPPALVPLRPIVRLRDSASPIERRDGLTAVAIEARGAGQVEQIGYRDLWRWRMRGDSGVAAHRRWWAARVSEVAYAPATRALQPVDADPAPLIAWIDRIGPPSAGGREARFPFRQPSLGWLLTAILAALVSEWWSRRLRGAR
jgi:hypothetical protein